MGAPERIFVQIASYRDPDCQWTIGDLFERAAHPDRIFVGVCQQLVPGLDQDCLIQTSRPDRISTHDVDARESKGACWARHLTQKLWRGEEYTLQIDSHMRFETGWDEKLLEMLKACPGERSVLTTYPMGFTPPRRISQRGIVTKLVAKEFDCHRILMFGSLKLPEPQAPPRPIPTAFLSACYLFGPSSIISDVPYDPNLYFYGEEVSMAVRLWTHGYDLFCPNRVALYHNWNRDGRRLHWDDADDSGRAARLNERAFARVRHLFGTEISNDPTVLHELDQYGFGTARSLRDYEAFTGISFAALTISERAKSFHFPVAGMPAFVQI